jgi:hypothetical protein
VRDDAAVQSLIARVLAAHGVRLDARQAAAMLEENRRYGALLSELVSTLSFEDEPGLFRLALDAAADAQP